MTPPPSVGLSPGLARGSHVSRQADRRARVTLVGLIVAVSVLVATAPAEASQVTVTDREASYPAEVANVSHAPWSPRAGEDVTVTLRLAANAGQPDAVSLLYCRVEPTYVCGLPLFMTASGDERTYKGVVEWDERFMKHDTVHVGYNVTLRYGEGADVVRTSAPTGNFWVPDSYPDDSDGIYYFLSYAESIEDAPGASWLTVLIMSAAALCALSGARRNDRGGSAGG